MPAALLESGEKDQVLAQGYTNTCRHRQRGRPGLPIDKLGLKATLARIREGRENEIHPCPGQTREQCKEGSQCGHQLDSSAEAQPGGGGSQLPVVVLGFELGLMTEANHQTTTPDLNFLSV